MTPELRVLEAALAFGKIKGDCDVSDPRLVALLDSARELADKRNSLVTAGIIDTVDVGAAGPFPAPKVLIIEADAFGTKRRLVIDRHNNLTAEAWHSDRWERASWLVDASSVISYALRRAICRGIDEAEVVETSDVIIIELGEVR